MSWLLSLLVAALSAVAGLFIAGIIANYGVGWYRVSSFEGASGYAVVAIAILGMFAGGIVGLVTARLVASGTSFGFLKALGTSLSILGATGAISAAFARLMADVGPRVDGKELTIEVEVRWPNTQKESPATLAGEGTLRLGSVTKMTRTQRASREGPLWLEDAKRVDGRWIVQGALDLFTHRGGRVIDVNVNDSTLAGFLLPIPAWPGRKDSAWTPWFPDPPDGQPRWPDDKFSIRYRIVTDDQPIRSQTFGPFQVISTFKGFYRTESPREGRRVGASTQFALKYRDQTVPLVGAVSLTDSTPVTFPHLEDVALIGGNPSALAVSASVDGTETFCYLLKESAGGPRFELIGPCNRLSDAKLLTSDPVRFKAAKVGAGTPGTVDRFALEDAGVYLIRDAVLDTRRGAVFHYTAEQLDVHPNVNVPPLGISPDERSFVEFAYGGDQFAKANLLVTDFVTGRIYVLPIDRRRMRYDDFDDLDPAWLYHHFAWKRDGGGIDQLVERTDFIPIPYHGTLTISPTDGSASYRIERTDSTFREALLEVLAAEAGAKPLPIEDSDYRQKVLVDGKTVIVASSSEFDYILIEMPDKVVDSALISRLATIADRALATGRFDSRFKIEIR